MSTWFKLFYSLADLLIILNIFHYFITIITALLEIALRRFVIIPTVGIMFFTYYLSAAYAYLLQFGLNDLSNSPQMLIAAGVFLFVAYGMGVVNKQRDAEQQFDYQTLDSIKYNYIGIFGMIILLIVFVYYPEYAINDMTKIIANSIDWVNNIPVIGFIIAIIAILYALSTIFYGIVMLLGIAGAGASGVYGLFKRNT